MTGDPATASKDSGAATSAHGNRALWRERLGRVGVWSMQLRTAPAQAIEHAAHDLDDAGFRALWIPGLDGGPVFADAQRLLTATGQASVVIGVQSIWKQESAELAAHAATVESRFPGRLLTGLGVSAAEVARALGKPFSTAVQEMDNYLQGLDDAPTPLAQQRRLLGSLGPAMARLAGARTAGLHPFLVPAEAAAGYRENLGNDALLAPHLAVVLDTDPSRAREIARGGIGFFLGLHTYQGNLRRLGFSDADFVPGGSDRLIDALVAWGDLDAVHARIQQHLDAGADHVALHVITPGQQIPSRQWAELATLLPHLT
ncbi:TIGR03620 family F420-dependent LLM class oxidoreductase [Catenuloplanes atrovinosus]|uniref:F420-dependent oxidoreductase n=1 Tax=Catenuloplanes atrovinosus TaxID=137266 RepID=A0AAE3YQ76_9ACTN|nr:TIGR03620 family F420-dependent LLM class oxidoreductase [Catenuloplanes atrovinosus]MDR7276625.1 putative F420-dependent oxidoreductase [Catenuloplanes atrovinosus]